MLTINATDARQLQKTGITPEEYMLAAADRIQSAIIDTARKGRSCVDVIVYDITLDQVPQILKELAHQDFKADYDAGYDDKPHKVFKISWG